MALVGVEYLGLRVPGDGAVGAHRPDAADAKQQFLAQPVVGAAAIEPVSDLPQVRIVLLNVGVQQQQRHPADLRYPDLRRQHGAIRQRHRYPDRTAGAVAQQGQRQAVRVRSRVALGLPALDRQGLREIAVAVQQADPDDRHTEVAGGLEVVAGQDAKAAGVLRQAPP